MNFFAVLLSFASSLLYLCSATSDELRGVATQLYSGSRSANEEVRVTSIDEEGSAADLNQKEFEKRLTLRSHEAIFGVDALDSLNSFLARAKSYYRILSGLRNATNQRIEQREYLEAVLLGAKERKAEYEEGVEGSWPLVEPYSRINQIDWMAALQRTLEKNKIKTPEQQEEFDWITDLMLEVEHEKFLYGDKVFPDLDNAETEGEAPEQPGTLERDGGPAQPSVSNEKTENLTKLKTVAALATLTKLERDAHTAKMQLLEVLGSTNTTAAPGQ